MAIIFLMYFFLSFCDAGVALTPTTGSPNQPENSTQLNVTSSYPTTIALPATPPANLDRSPSIDPTKGCPTVSPATTSAYNKLFRVDRVLMVAGGLILACTILLISTLLLAWKVCQLSRSLKMLSGHSDLMIPAKYWKDNNKSDADAKETAVLMSDLNQTRDEAGDGGSGPDKEKEEEEEEEGGHENGGVEQKGNGAKNGEVKETPAAAPEDPSGPKEEGSKKSPMDKTETSPASGEKQGAKDGE